MRFTGVKIAMLAAGLMLAGASQAAPQTPAAPPPAASAATTPAAAAPAAKATPAAAATPTDPMLAQDGAPPITIDPKVGQPVDGYIGIQPIVTKTGLRARNFHDYWLVPTITVISNPPLSG